MVSGLASDKDRPQLLDTVVDSWLNRDRYGFSEFLAAWPQSGDRDRWAEKLCSNLTMHADPTKNDYPSSIEWALSIQNPKLKDKALCEAIDGWQEDDKLGLHAYVKDRRTPPTHREAVKRLLTSAPNE